MKNDLFYLGVALHPYKENPKLFRGLLRQLNAIGLQVLDAEETPIVDSKTEEVKFEALVILLRELIPGGKDALVGSLKSTKEGYSFPYVYNGLPMYM